MHTLTENNFVERFMPQVNTLDDNASFDFGRGGCLYETYGRDLAAVRAADPAHIWTVLESDGEMFIASGFHFVNRLGYLLTEVPVPAGEDYIVELDFGE